MRGNTRNNETAGISLHQSLLPPNKPCCSHCLLRPGDVFHLLLLAVAHAGTTAPSYTRQDPPPALLARCWSSTLHTKSAHPVPPVPPAHCYQPTLKSQLP